MDMLLRQVLANTQQLREVSGMLQMTVLMKTESGIIKKMREEGVKYNEECQKRGAGHTLGPPHVHIVMGMMDGLMEAKISTEKKATVEKIKRAVEACKGPEEAACLVKACKVEKAHSQEVKKIRFALDDNMFAIREETFSDDGKKVPASYALLQALGEAGGQKKAGRAPRGYMEEVISKYVEKQKEREEK